MATPTRQTIISGPGAVIFGGQTIHDKEGIEASIESQQEAALSSLYGQVTAFKADQVGKITFTPCGSISADLLAVLFPHASPVMGASLFGAADAPAVVHSLAGVKLTAHAAALTKIPSLALSPVRTAFGQAELTFLVANGLAPSTASGFYTVAAAAFTATALADTAVKTGVYLGTYNATTIHTQDGWTVEFDLQTTPVVIDDTGTVDLLLSGLTVRASCTPVGITEADLMALQPHLLDRGSSMIGAYDLTIATTVVGGLSVVLKNARCMTGPLAWGNGKLRAGQLGFTAHREFTAGVGAALYSVAVVAGT